MNPIEVHNKMREKGQEKARAQAYYTTQDRIRKEVRAMVMVEHINAGKAIGTSEQLALVDPRYIEACERAEQAEEAAGVAAVEFEAARAWFSAWQTMEATKREELKITRGAA